MVDKHQIVVYNIYRGWGRERKTQPLKKNRGENENEEHDQNQAGEHFPRHYLLRDRERRQAQQQADQASMQRAVRDLDMSMLGI